MHWFTHWHHWDLVRQWIGSLGPVVALGAAVVPYWHNSKDRRRSQATHLYCDHSVKYNLALPGDGIPTGLPEHDGVKALPFAAKETSLNHELVDAVRKPDADPSLASFRLSHYSELVKLELYSTSDEPFFNIAVWVTGKDRKEKLAIVQHQLQPMGKLRRYVYFDPGTLPIKPLRIRFEFQDANGRSWQRVGSNPVEHLRRRTPTHANDSSDESIAVRCDPKPDFYNQKPCITRQMSADEIAELVANASTPDKLDSETTTSDADETQ